MYPCFAPSFFFVKMDVILYDRDWSGNTHFRYKPLIQKWVY